MSGLGWKAPYPGQKGSRWSDSKPLLFDPAVVRDAGFADDPLVSMEKDSATAPGRYLSRMCIRAGSSIVLIRIRDVVWVQSHRNLLRLHLQNITYQHRMTMKDIYKRLDPERFLRVHRNAIVNLDHVVEFQLPRFGKACVHLSTGQVLPVSQTARLLLRRGLLSQCCAAADGDAI